MFTIYWYFHIEIRKDCGSNKWELITLKKLSKLILLYLWIVFCPVFEIYIFFNNTFKKTEEIEKENIILG